MITTRWTQASSKMIYFTYIFLGIIPVNNIKNWQNGIGNTLPLSFFFNLILIYKWDLSHSKWDLSWICSINCCRSYAPLITLKVNTMWHCKYSSTSVLLVEETRVPAENYRPVASHWQTFILFIFNDITEHFYKKSTNSTHF
jgi:hypothetical protein